MQKSPTTAQLRDDIDSGRTGDKVGASDPAAAPLGTDEEAAGTPLSPADIEAARQAEARPAADRPAMSADATKASERSGGRWVVLTITAVVVVAAILMFSGIGRI